MTFFPGVICCEATFQSYPSFNFLPGVISFESIRNADRFLGALASQGGLRSLMKIGLTEAETGVREVREVAERLLGGALRPWHWSYRIRIGIV